MASLDPVAFLRATPPFNALPAALFAAAAGALEIGYYPAGSILVRVGADPLQHLYVIRKGSVRLERDGQTLQVLEEGETFGYTSLLTGKATLDVQVEDDLLAYRLPAAQFQRLLGDAQFAGHFAVGLSQRLKSSLEHSPVTTSKADLQLEVAQLLRRPASWVEADATVGDAARVMRDNRISSVLVRGDPPGIVTDRDFRNRVLAEGLGPATAGGLGGLPPPARRGRRHAHLGGLDHAARHRQPPPAHPARRRDHRRAHLHRPAQGPRARVRWRCCGAWSGCRTGPACPGTPTR